MSTEYVPLALTADGVGAGLREICGWDEELVGDTATATALELLDRLMDRASSTGVGSASAARLTASDRDRLLAAVYERTYGPRIESTVHCRHCQEPFDLDFSLPELLAGLQGTASGPAVETEPRGTFKLADGRRFRLPTGEDECAVRYLPPDQAEVALLARCVIEGDPAAEPEALQAAMEAVAPVLDLELDAQCPECGASQPIHFDIQSYLLAALAAERSQLAREVHRLATAYGWSRQEILAIPRSQRRAYVALIEDEMVEQRRWHR